MGRARYWREIAAVIAVKALALGVLYLWFFAPASQLQPTSAQVFQHVAEQAHD